jgi:ATP-dependent Clp protease, protease subunit
MTSTPFAGLPLSAETMSSSPFTSDTMPLIRAFDNASGSDRMDIFNRLLKNRIVMLGTEVNDEIANLLTGQLLFLEGEDNTRDIWLYINSPGGSVTAGLAIYDTMNFISCDVATICMGLAASMGQFLLCAGAKGKRYSLPHSRIMMHQPSGGIRGSAADVAIQADQIREDSERDRWFTADEAKTYGHIDHVIVRRGEII